MNKTKKKAIELKEEEDGLSLERWIVPGSELNLKSCHISSSKDREWKKSRSSPILSFNHTYKQTKRRLKLSSNAPNKKKQ
jgi:hypothetical protein